MKHILVLDIEATGLDANASCLLELSAVRLSADFTNELAVFDSLVKPSDTIPPFIERLTGISDKMVENAPTTEAVREQFLQFLKPSDIICGHNIQFDIGFLNAKGFDIQNPSLDTFSLAHIFLPEEPSYSLEILTERYEIEHSDAHRALNDVRANTDLLKTILGIAEGIPTELRKQYAEVLTKSGWVAKEILLTAFEIADKKAEKIKKTKAQPSLFDIPDNTFLMSLSKKPARETTEQEEKAGTRMAAEILKEKSVLITLPLELSELSASAIAAKKFYDETKESVVIAVPDMQGKPTPAGFFRYASPKDVLCETAYCRWFAEQKELDEAQTIVALKYLRERFVGNSLITADFPAVYSEKQIAREWLDVDHTRCPSDCAAKVMRLKSLKRPLYFCEYEHLEECPAQNAILLKSDNLIHHIDSFSRERFSVDYLEKALTACQIKAPEFVEGVLFGIGLLKRFVREQVGESPYSKNLVFENIHLENQEIKNLADGFFEAATLAAKKCPENSQLREDFQKLGELLTEPVAENECRFVSINSGDSLYFVRAPKLLSEKLQKMVEKKSRVTFVGSVFLRKKGSAIFGSGLDAPQKQVTIASEFDFSKQSAYFIPQFGGNLKSSDESTTVGIVEKVLPVCEGNMLVLLPSAAMAENLCSRISETAEQHGFHVLTASGSSAKLKAQLQRGKLVLVATSNSIRKVDFRTVRFCGCVQHRIFFDPPPDPAVVARNQNISDEFLDFALPQAVQRFQRLLQGLACSGHKFFWICLDAGFHKPGNYTAEFLDALPAAMPVKHLGIQEISGETVRFLES